MRSLRVVLDPDEAATHPVQAFVRDHDDLTDYRLLHFNPTADGDVALVFHVRGDRTAYESALAEYSPDTYAVAEGRGSSFYVYARESLSGATERLTSAFTRAGLVVVSPIAYRDDGTVALGVVGPADALRAALAAVPAGVDVDVRRVGRYDAAALAPTGRLTDRQHEALRVAHELGYYRTPRAATTADVADQLGCAPGTAAEHLRKAEARIVGRAVGGEDRRADA